MLELLDADAILNLDGGTVREIVNYHLRRMAVDIADRPGDDKDRVITVKIKLKPQIDQRGPRDEAALQVTCTSSVPDHRSAAMSVGVRKDGKFAYNPDSPSNVNQATFDMDDDA